MEFGVCLNAKIDEVGIVTHMENLGYSHAWIADTQMYASEVYATLALAAQQTRKIHIGPGVAVAGLRIAPVTVQAIGTIARLAPGRTFLGLGTGNTAWHLMGQKPPPMAEFAEYLRVVRGLLSGETVDYTVRGRTAPIRYMHPQDRFTDFTQKIPLLVSGFGPKAQALAGEFGDGLVISIPRVHRLEDALMNVRAGAARAGRKLAGFHTTALCTLALLEPGEDVASERVVRTYGPSIMASVHYVYEKLHATGGEPPAWVRPIWSQFCALMDKVPRRELHFALHGNHYMYVPPEEARLITPEIVKAVCVVGKPEEIVERLRELEQQGLNQIMFLPPVSHQYRVIEDFARKVMEKM